MNTLTQNYNRVYSANRWSFEHFFCIFVYFVIFALPFYFSFADKYFWFDPQHSLVDIKYHFTGFYAVQVNYIQNSKTNVQQFGVLPSTTLANLSGLTLTANDNQNISTFTLQLTKFNQSFQILSVNLILFYDVQVPSLYKVASSSFAATILNNVINAKITSKLSLQVSTPFDSLTSLQTTTINKPSYFDTDYNTPSNFQALLNSHMQNQYKLQQQTYVQAVSGSPVSRRTISLSLTKDKQVVLPYYPSILETLKLKFSLYFGMLILSYLIFYNLMLELVKSQALQCHQRDQIANIITNH